MTEQLADGRPFFVFLGSCDQARNPSGYGVGFVLEIHRGMASASDARDAARQGEAWGKSSNTLRARGRRLCSWARPFASVGWTEGRPWALGRTLGHQGEPGSLVISFCFVQSGPTRRQAAGGLRGGQAPPFFLFLHGAGPFLRDGTPVSFIARSVVE